LKAALLCCREARANLLATQPFAATFGKARTRKRPRLAVDSFEEFAKRVDDRMAR
jgi:nuclear GTP-binding protein